MAQNVPASVPGVAVARDGKGKWQKGQTGNPRGRLRRGQTLAELIREKLDRPKFVEKLLKLAYDGDLSAMKLILDYVEPLPKNGRSALLSAGGVTVQVVYAPAAALPPQREPLDVTPQRVELSEGGKNV